MNNFKEITIERRRLDDPFARIPKNVIDDPNVSCKAKFILCYVLSKPNDWIVRVNDIINHCTDGESAVRSGINELRAAGYAKMDKIRKGGRFYKFMLTFSDQPDLKDEELKSPQGEKPFVENPQVEKPQVENRHLSKNDITNIELTKNELPLAKATAVLSDNPEPTDKPKSNQRNITDLWCLEYKQATGQVYVFQGVKDAKAAQSVLKSSIEPAEFIRIARQAWAKKDARKFWKCVNWSHNLAVFWSKFNEIRAELKAHHVPQAGEAGWQPSYMPKNTGPSYGEPGWQPSYMRPSTGED